MDIHKVYKITFQTDEGNYIYIGRTKQSLEQRLQRHNPKSGRMEDYASHAIRQAFQNTPKKKVKMTLIQNNMTEREAKEFERRTIKKYYRNQRHFLLNLYAGGEKLTDTHGAKINDNRKPIKQKLWSKPEKLRVIETREHLEKQGYHPLCAKCFTEKPMSEFPLDISKTRGHRSWCDDCTKKRKKEQYEKRKEEAERLYPNRHDDLPFETSYCSKCKKEKSKYDFEWQPRNPYHLSYSCKECRRLRQRKYKYERIADDTKVKCGRCQITKTAKDFLTNRSRKNGLQSSCIPCSRIQCKESRRRKNYERVSDDTDVRCLKCKKTKKAKDFAPDKRHTNGLQCWCKECSNTLAKKSRQQKKVELQKEAILKFYTKDGKVRCSICKEAKSSKDFYVNVNKKNKLNSYCKSCFKVKYKKGIS